MLWDLLPLLMKNRHRFMVLLEKLSLTTGQSSNVPFISRVLKIVLPEREGQLLNSTPPSTPARANPYILPPKPLVLQLLQLYFTRCAKLFPYIDEREFYEEYNKAELSGFHQIRRSWLALLNIVFAMALQLDGSGFERDERTRLADTFYQRSRGLHHEIRVNTVESSKPLFRCPKRSSNVTVDVSISAKYPGSKRMLGNPCSCNSGGSKHWVAYYSQRRISA